MSTRRPRLVIVQTPEELAAKAAKGEFIAALKSKGGQYWCADNGSNERMYFDRTDADYSAEIASLRATGADMSVWPNKKIGYVVIDTQTFVSTRRGVNNAGFRISLGF